MVVSVETELLENVVTFLEFVEGPENVKAFCERAILEVIEGNIC